MATERLILKGVDGQGHQVVTTLDVPIAATSALQRYLPPTGKVRPGAYVSGNGVVEAQAWLLEGSRGSVVKGDVKAYYDLTSGSIPSTAHKAIAAAGHPIHCPVALKGPTAAVAARGIPAPALSVGSPAVGVWTYQQVTAGALDGYWAWLAAQFKAVAGLVAFSLNIEPENQSATTGRRESFSNPAWYSNRTALGVPAVKAILKEYADAYRYVRAKLTAAGVTNVVYSMNYGAMNYAGAYHEANVYPALWPGTDAVDMLGWDPYTNTPATQSLAQRLAPTVTYLRGGGLASSAYQAAGVTSMPWHLPEFGATPTTDAAAIAWIQQIPTALAAVPELRALSWYSSAGTESTTIHTLPAVRAAYAEICSATIFAPVTG